MFRACLVLLVLFATACTTIVWAAPADHDLDDNGKIDFNEAWAALAKLRDGKITMVDAWDTIELYYTQGAVPGPGRPPTPTHTPTPYPTPTPAPTPEHCLPQTGVFGPGHMEVTRSSGGSYTNAGGIVATFKNPKGDWAYGFRIVWSSGIRWMSMKVTHDRRWLVVIKDPDLESAGTYTGQLDAVEGNVFRSGPGETNTLALDYSVNLRTSAENQGYWLRINSATTLWMPRTHLADSTLNSRPHYYDMVANQQTAYSRLISDVRRCGR